MCNATPAFWIQNDVLAAIWFSDWENNFLQIDLNYMAHISIAKSLNSSPVNVIYIVTNHILTSEGSTIWSFQAA